MKPQILEIAMILCILIVLAAQALKDRSVRVRLAVPVKRVYDLKDKRGQSSSRLQ